MNHTKPHRSRSVLAALVSALLLSVVLLPAATQVSAAASLRLSRGAVAPGDSITVQGNGFSGIDNVVVATYVTANSQTRYVAATVLSDQSGFFSATLAFPAGTAEGTYTVIAKDFHGHTATKDIVVLPLISVKVGGTTPVITVPANHGFFVQGSGFGAQEPVRIAVPFHLYDGNTLVVTRDTGTNRDGAFGEVFLQVPRNARQAGNVLTTAGQSTNKKAYARVNITYRPELKTAAGSVRPGAAIVITGHDYVPNSRVNVSVTIPRNGATTETLTRTVTSNGNGDFSTSIVMPNNVRLGRYTVSAVDQIGGFKASATILVSVHPVVALTPNAAQPGQAVTVKGSSFSIGVQVTIQANFQIVSGGHRNASTNVQSNNNGAFELPFVIPRDATSQSVSIQAREAHGSASAQLSVQRPRPHPTSTPLPTATPTATPAPTSTAVPVKHPSTSLSFSYVSIWYHYVRQGTYDHIVLHASPHQTLGIWTRVKYPSGQQVAYYEQTDSHGNWEKQFPVPRGARTASNDEAFITLQLWKGSHTRKTYRNFHIVY